MHTGIWPLLTVAAVLLLFAVAAAGRSGRSARRDPQRGFSHAQRLACFQRAGMRCEHFTLLGRRCRRAPANADHIHPWARGGATTLDNAAALCRDHNAAKSARILSPFYITRLEHRRRKYFPPGEPVRVIWRHTRP